MAVLPKYNTNGKQPLRRQLSRVPTAKQLVGPPDSIQTTGYAQAAGFIATDKELSVYRRFDRTAARVLLTMQSEITSKQKRLDILDQEDAKDPNDEKAFISAATIFEELQNRGPRDEEKNILLGELRRLLKEYCR